MRSNFAEMLPSMLFGKELKQKMTYLPEYREEYRKMEPGQRLLKLNDIFKVFVPRAMNTEVYTKLYMMTIVSLQQKGTVESVQRINEIRKRGFDVNYKGVISGVSSTTILGASGIGKTTCIQKAMEMMGDVLELYNPYVKIIPVVLVNCPFDCNYKGLLGQILLSIDDALGTDYYVKSKSRSYNAQGLMAMVCQLCQIHVGILVIDEIQFLMQHKSGTMLFRMILQLINAAKVGVILVGTEECRDYLQQAPQMARRSTGLLYRNLPYNGEFCDLARTLFRYQYTEKQTDLTDGILSWLYEHTAGNPANLMALIHDTQEVAILSGKEKIDAVTLTGAYTSRMRMLHPYIEPSRKRLPGTSRNPKEKKQLPEKEILNSSNELEVCVADLALKIKEQGIDAPSAYSKHFPVEEVAI